MQIRLSRDLEGRARAAPSPMTVEEFFAGFPEVPLDLRDEPVLAEFVRAFGSQLRVAQKPSPCVAQAGAGDAEHHFTRVWSTISPSTASASPGASVRSIGWKPSSPSTVSRSCWREPPTM